MAILRWTRQGVVEFGWGPHAEPPLLVHGAQVRARLEKLVQGFLVSKEKYHRHHLVWRQGLFVFGEGGCGKTAFTMAVARVLGWEHFTIPGHEILDSHFLEAALSSAVSRHHRLVVIEDIDQILRRVEAPTFFGVLDHAMERGDGVFWVATTRRPELTPKSLLVRPGRFDEAMRLDLPSKELRASYLMAVLSGLAGQAEASLAEGGTPVSSDQATQTSSGSDGWISEWIDATEGLSYAHLEEIRHLVIRLEVEGREAELRETLRDYLSDQVIAGNRSGGEDVQEHELERRVVQMDPRLLMAGLDMTDVIKRVMEKSISDALLSGELSPLKNS